MKRTKQAINEAAGQVGDQLNETQSEKYKSLTDRTLQKSLSVKAMAGVSDEKEEAIYAQAYRLYNTGRYKESAEIFRLLVSLNTMDPRYLLGFAACFHMMKVYESAISAYSLAAAIDLDSPIPHFHLSDCYLQLKDDVSAITALKTAIKRSGDKGEYASLKEKCEITLAGLEQQAQEKAVKEKKK